MKYNLGKIVTYNETMYLLSACVIRKSDDGFFYQAELKDPAAKSSLIYADLAAVKEQAQ